MGADLEVAKKMQEEEDRIRDQLREKSVLVFCYLE